MTPKDPHDKLAPARSPSVVLQQVLKRAHVEAHDGYIPDDRRDPDALRDDCAALFRELRFDEALARAMRDPDWERDPMARLQVGVARHYQQRYDEAREEYRIAADLSDRDSFKASCMANTGTTWFEQGVFDRAMECYDDALKLYSTREAALLGRIGVASQRRDPESLLAAVHLLRERRPDWRESPSIVEQILKDRSYRFLRDSPGLFERAFEVPLQVLIEERIRTVP